VGLISKGTIEFVDRVAAAARRIETPCGAGCMVWRVWGDGPPLVLLHGGYGSWTHWIRNVLPLSRRFTVFAADTPGLGESDMPPDPTDPEAIAAVVADGIERLLPGDSRFHLAGFSYGGVLGGHVVARLGDKVRGFTIVGSGGMGLKREPTPLQRVPKDANDAEGLAIHRGNLAMLMIADPANIDELAVYLQSLNAPRGRIKSRRFSRSATLLEALHRITIPRIDGIWGERDATAYPHLDERVHLLREIRPNARFAIVPGAGHWVQYEAPDRFNELLTELAQE
jgi:pimeloyl-ACP methyl ester carboxylesterase